MQLRVDLALEVAHRPVLALGFDLVESARVWRLDFAEELAVRPAQTRREARAEFARRCLANWGESGYTRRRLANRAASTPARFALGFAPANVSNRGRPMAVRQVEGPEVPQVRRRVAPPDARQQLLRQALDHLLSVLGPRLATLHVVDDLAADVPVREQHLAVDGPDDACARVLDDRRHALDERGEAGTPGDRARLSQPCGDGPGARLRGPLFCSLCRHGSRPREPRFGRDPRNFKRSRQSSPALRRC